MRLKGANVADEARVFSRLPKKYIPFYEALCTHYKEWAPIFRRWEELKEKVQSLEVQRAEVERLPLSRADFLSKVRRDFEVYQAERVSRISKALREFQAAQGPTPLLIRSVLNELSGFQNREGASVTWTEIEAAAKELPEGTSAKDREKRLEKFDKQLAELRVELDRCRPQARYLYNQSHVVSDSWAVFVEHWRRLQSRANAPISPDAMALDLSEDDEKWAWKELGLKQYVNARGSIPAGTEEGEEGQP